METPHPTRLNPCCRTEAARRIRRHRDVATCDACGRLLLGYGDEGDFRKTISALTEAEIPHEWERMGTLYVVAKKRNGPSSSTKSPITKFQ